MIQYCKHGQISGSCGCWSARKTETLLDAWLIYKSGKGSWLEWNEASEILFHHGYESEGADCALRAIDALASFPKIEQIHLRNIISRFVKGHLNEEELKSQGKISLSRLATRFRAARAELAQLRYQRKNLKQRTATLVEADLEIENSINDADGGGPHERVRLAKMLRKFNKYKEEYRWDKPSLAVTLMEEQLAQSPNNVAARNLLASALGDLGQWDRAEAEAWTALGIVADDTEQRNFMLHTMGRILNGKGDGYRAWGFLKEAMDHKHQASTAAMLNISCALAELQENLTTEQRGVLQSRRKYISNLLEMFDKRDKNSAEAILVRITMQALVFEERFVEALVYMRELTEEGRTIRSSYWDKEVNGAIIRTKGSVKKVRLQAGRVIKDLFPDFGN